MVRIQLTILAALALLPLGCGQERSSDPEPDTSAAGEDTDGPEPPAGQPAVGSLRGRVVYVPAYSHLTSRDRDMLMAITLSVRNVDPSATVTLTHVDYFDTSGHRVRRYLRAPRRLAPLETVEFSVDALDEVGGSGANFLVYWEGPSDAHPLLTETVMFGHVGTGYMSFTSRGVELDRPPELAETAGETAPAPQPETAPATDP